MPKLEFLANMNISPLTVEELRKLGWNIMRVPEVMDRRRRKMIRDKLRSQKSHNYLYHFPA